MTPKVSICIPTYRQTEYLKRTLDSVLAQDYADYEVVVTDDSPDATVEDLLRHYSFDARVRYIRNNPSLGSPANWNHAVRLAQGEYVKVLHHDDWFATSSALSGFVEMLDSNPTAGFGFSGAVVRNGSTGKTWRHGATDGEIACLRNEPTCLFYGNFIGPPSSTIFRRASFVEYDEKLVWAVDIAQYIAILKNTDFVATQRSLIVSTTNARHQITGACLGDSRVNVFEYFYLFNEIEPQIPVRSRDAYVSVLVELIHSYKISSTEGIQQTGYAGNVPPEILSSLKASLLTRFLFLLRLRISRRFKALARSARHLSFGVAWIAPTLVETSKR